jgi:hypothetical protein
MAALNSFFRNKKSLKRENLQKKIASETNTFHISYVESKNIPFGLWSKLTKKAGSWATVQKSIKTEFKTDI